MNIAKPNDKKIMNNNDFSYDPVTAIDEDKASGETAKIFSDIRNTMGIPLITSIWRGLAGMNNNLPKVWRLAKPIYKSGKPEKALFKMVEELNLPIPKTLKDSTIEKTNLNNEDLRNIKQIIKVYNRSNGMNLIALSALVMINFNPIEEQNTKPMYSLDGNFPNLMTKDIITSNTWNIIRKVNTFGSPSGIDSQVATLWRHLAYWPNFLSLVHDELKPLQTAGIIEETLETVLKYIINKGIVLQQQPTKFHNIDDNVVTTITNYVHTKYQVIRMVTIGNMMEKWLKDI